MEDWRSDDHETTEVVGVHVGSMLSAELERRRRVEKTGNQYGVVRCVETMIGASDGLTLDIVLGCQGD